MRKKVNLLLLMILVVSILALALSACNAKDISGAPEDVGVNEPSGSIAEDTTRTDRSLMLKFVFTQYMSSVFTAIPINEFRLSNIKYQFVYADSGMAFSNELFDLTEDMIDSDCKAFLSQPGRHQIKVTFRREGAEPIRGAFTLNLSAQTEAVDLVTITIDLDGGQAINFKSATNSTDSKVAIKVPRGTTFPTWNNFESTFLMKKVRKDAGTQEEINQIPTGLIKDNKTFDADSTSPLVLNEDAEYKVLWKDARVTVSFDYNKPEGAKVKEGKNEQTIINATANQTVNMDVGTVIMPNANDINIYSGYIFAGWYTKNGDKNSGVWGDKWLSTQTVGRKDFTLYAKWEKTEYTLKIFTMGATFKDNITQLTAAQIANEGLIYVDSDVYFDITTKEPNDITLSGFHYGVSYSKCYTVLQVKAGDESATVTVRVSDFYNDSTKLLQKAGDKFELKNLYVEVYDAVQPGQVQANTKTTKDITLDKVEGDIKAYINWSMKDSVKTDTDGTLSDYYINYAFKNGITLKADGTLRIDLLADLSINELVVPAGITWVDGEYRPITEIGTRAVMNAKSLVTLDMTAAENLTKIGERAFCYCQSLSNIYLPTKNNITEVGEQAFAKTYWEDHVKGDIIVFGTAIYKYIGQDKAEIDMNDYVGEDKLLASNKIYSLSAGCFVDATKLETITLSDNIDVIYNYAFRGLKSLKKVVASADAKLYYIGEDAFFGCDDYMSGRVNENLDGEKKAILVGSVFYRLISKEERSYNVPASYEDGNANIIVKHIAPLAFTGCADLANITFEEEATIKTIGKDAFIDTKWMQDQQDGYTVVNGILANVYSQDYNLVNITIPYGAGGQPTATTISEYAFHTYSRYIETIDIRDNVEKIEDYAFIGASSLKSLIFTSAKLNPSKDEIVGIPAISNNSFANANGELLRGVTLYFTQDVYNYFATTACKDSNPDWYTFYSLYPSAFKVEKVTDYYINPSIQKERILNEEISAFDDYPTNGIVAESNSGVDKYFSLSRTDNVVTLYRMESNTPVEVGKYQKTNGVVTFYLKNGENYVAGILPEGTYYLSFTFEKVEYTHFDDEHAFVINVHNSIYGNPEKNSTLDGDAEWAKAKIPVYEQYDQDWHAGNARTFWIETFDGSNWVEGFKGDKELGGYPAFYTSRTSLDLTKYRFVYYDYKKVLHTISFADSKTVTVSGFAPTINNTPNLIFKINFYDICYYELELTYRGVKSLYANDESGVGIYQNESISIPLNGNPTTYVRNSYVYFKGQDGRTQKMLLNFNSFKIVTVDNKSADTLATEQLGWHTAHITYTSSETDGTLEGDLVYAVVLDADNSAFSYEVVNDLRKEAKITHCSSTTADTIVLPNTCQIGDETYTIVEIASSVFANFVNLKTVYLPSTLKKLGNNAFYGCTSLKEVFTASQTEYASSNFDASSFNILTEDVEEHGTVVVKGLVYTLLSVLNVPEKITWTETETIIIDEQSGLSYTRNVTRVADLRFTDDLFNNFRGTICLYDNEYNRNYAAKHIEEFETVNREERRVRTVKFYTESDSIIIAANSRFELGKFTPYTNENYDVNGAGVAADELENNLSTRMTLKPTSVTLYGNTVKAESFVSGKLNGVEILVVPEKLTWVVDDEKITVNDGVANYSFECKATRIAPVEFADDLFDDYDGIIYLFDNEYNRAYATAHLGSKTVRWYDNDENSLESMNVTAKPATSDFFNTTEFAFNAVKSVAEDSVVEIVSKLADGVSTEYIIIPEKLVWNNEVVRTVTITRNKAEVQYDYTREVIRYSTLNFATDLFANYNGTIYLFDNEYNRDFALSNLKGKNVVWYDNDENKLTLEQEAEMAGADSFVFEKIVNKDVARNVKLLSLEGVNIDDENNVFVLSGVNHRYEKEDNENVWYKTTNKVIEAAEVVNVKASTKDFVVYLPDTIYTSCVINNTLKDVENDYNDGILTIYKSGNKTLVSTLSHAPDSLEYIGATAFANCPSLETVEFGKASRLEYIGDSAFAGDSSFESITLSSALEIIGNRAFENCDNFVLIKFLDIFAKWQEVDCGEDWFSNPDLRIEYEELQA